MMIGLCPNCGINLTVDEPMVLGPLNIDPNGAVVWHGVTITLTPSERTVLHTLAKASPHYVSRLALRERLGTESGWDVISVFLSRIRTKFRAQSGVPIPIENGRGKGLRLP